ncbi:MAG: hypothetical protein ACFB50_00900, partial [Rubrobacteraceae bacterium]
MNNNTPRDPAHSGEVLTAALRQPSFLRIMLVLATTVVVLVGMRLAAPVLNPILFAVILNVWCELSVRDLSGRCPRSKVGLLTDPEGKGTDSSCSTWTPSSPHFT